MPTVGTTYVTANVTSTTLNTDTYDLTNGAYLFLAPYVDVINEGGGNGVDLNFVSNGFAQIDGLVNGSQPIYFAAADGSTDIADIKIAATGVIEAGLPGLANGSAIGVASGQYQISNAGDVEGNIGQFAVLLNLNLANTARGSGGGTLVNTGVIASVGGSGVANFDTASTDSDIVVNDGSIVAGRFGLDDEGGHVTTVSNYGHIVGGVCAVYAGGSESLTNAGTLTGAVNLGLLSTITNSGEIDGAVTLAADDNLVDSGKIVGVVTLGVGASLSVSGEIDGTVTLAGAVAGSSTQVLISSSGVLTSNAASTLAVKTGVYDIVNAGDIENTLTGADDLLLNGAGYLVNSGTIASHGNAVSNNATLGSDYLYNSGTIAGIYDGVVDTGGHAARIVNQGTISGGITGLNSIYADIVTQTRLVNGGTISGDLELDAAGSTIVNSGAIDGDIYFGFVATQVASDFGSGVTASGVSLARSGSDRLVNSGAIDGNITFIGVSNVYLGKGGSFTGTLTGTGADGRYYAGAGVETFDLTSAGAVAVVGGTGETTFEYGATFTNSMTAQGGSGTTIVDLTGNYAGANALFLGARTMVDVDKIVFAAGFSYSLSVNAATVKNGATMTIDASAVGTGLGATLNISKDVGGFYDFIGGAGQNTIVAAASALFANDVFAGGGNALNAINFKTAGTVLSAAFANVAGFSTINLVSGTNDIQLNDFMVTKANNKTLAVNLSTGADIIDSSLLITASNNVVVNAQNASGDDMFIFGAAKETVNLAAGVSTSVNYDTISNFNFGTGSSFDALTVVGYNPVANAIDASVSGSLSTASFDADLATALAGHLNNGDALLFTANAGSLAGDTFLIASTNGAAGYAAGDLVVRLTGTTTGTLATANL